MLYLEEDYQENKSDFDEINSNIEKINLTNYSVSKKPDENEEKLSFKTKLIMFLCGFSYVGFLILSVFWTLVLRGFFEDELALSVAIISALYFSLFGIMLFFVFKNKKYFISKIKDPTKYLYGLLFALATIAIEVAVSYVINVLFPADTNANQQTVIDYTTNYPTLMFFVTVLIGPFCEEFTYRVGLYELLKEKNEIMAFIVSSLVFAFIHISFSDTTLAAELTSYPIYLTIGLCFTYAYKKYGLPCSYVSHVMLNLISYMAITFQQ